MGSNGSNTRYCHYERNLRRSRRARGPPKYGIYVTVTHSRSKTQKSKHDTRGAMTPASFSVDLTYGGGVVGAGQLETWKWFRVEAVKARSAARGGEKGPQGSGTKT
eukprot:2097248-Prymnesium_polylepis.1